MGGPCLLIGAFIGSALNTSAPGWLVLVLLTVILVYSAYKALQKAVQTFRKERALDATGAGAASNARLSRNPIERLLRFCNPGRYAEQFDTAGAEAAGGAAPLPHVVGHIVAEDACGPGPVAEPSEIQLEVAAESATATARAGKPPEAATVGKATSLDPRQQVQFPKRRLALFGSMWLLVVVTIFVRGGKAAAGLVPFCTLGYWLAALIASVLLAIMSCFAACRAVAHASPASDVDDGLHWDVRTARRIQLCSLAAGTLAALCGIGGGMIMGPILLGLGFLPQVQSATTATTLFVLSTSTCLAFLVAGTAPLDYALWLAFMTGLGAVFGKAVIGWIVKRFRRPSIIMFLLGGIITASVVAMVITGTIDVINDIQHGNDMFFRGLCDFDDN